MKWLLRFNGEEIPYGVVSSQQSMGKWIPHNADVGYESRMPSCLPAHKLLGNAIGSKEWGARSLEFSVGEMWQEASKMEESIFTLGGRLTLIKSVMDSLPTYMVILFRITKIIEKKINQLRRTSLWQGNKRVGGFNLVKWDGITLNEREGLGMKKLRLHNNYLLRKWLWIFCIEDMSLWIRFIVEMFGLFNLWTTEEVYRTFGYSVWIIIRRLWIQFNTNISFKMENGMKTQFWFERWIYEDYLKPTFLYPTEKWHFFLLWNPHVGISLVEEL